jgi:hypothetical protein
MSEATQDFSVTFTSEQVCGLRADLFDALTLLHAANLNVTEYLGEEKDLFTGPDSRATALIDMADAKVKAALGVLLSCKGV